MSEQIFKKLWLLYVRDENYNPDQPYMYSLIVRAIDETTARNFAASCAEHEGVEMWLDYNRSSCQEIYRSGETKVLLQDIRG